MAKNLNVDFTQSLQQQGARLKVLYSPQPDLGVGAMVGTMPTANWGQTPVFGLVGQTHFLPKRKAGEEGFDDKASMEFLVHPKPGVYSFGFNWGATLNAASQSFGADLGLNALWMPHPSLGKQRPWDYQLTFTVRYGW